MSSIRLATSNLAQSHSRTVNTIRRATVPTPLHNISRQSHMACHDYTNKLSYSVAAVATVATVSSTSNNSPPQYIAHVAQPSQSSATTNNSKSHNHQLRGGHRGNNSTGNKTGRGGRKAKLIPEDPDYLAHGTGIPR